VTGQVGTDPSCAEPAEKASHSPMWQGVRWGGGGVREAKLPTLLQKFAQIEQNKNRHLIGL